jgi:multimeric flavodoxin WrbA
MKVVLFNGSPRKEGNTFHALQILMKELKSNNIECEYFWIGAENLRGCRACYQCAKNKDKRCSIIDDKINSYIAKITKADGIVIGSPTYFANVSSPVKAFIDRVGLVSKVNGDILYRKIGAAVVAVRRQGATHVFSSINFFFLINQMFVVGSTYWNLGFGQNPGDIKKDQEGINTFKNLGRNMTYILYKLNENV